MNSQMELNLLGVVSNLKQPVELSIDKILSAENGAFNVCVDGYLGTRNELAARLQIHPAQFSKISSGKFHLPSEKRPLLQRLCGNIAMHQWEAEQLGRVSVTKERLHELEAIEAAYNSIMNAAKRA